MDEHKDDELAAAERRRILSSIARFDADQPLSSIVQVEFGAHSRPGRRDGGSDDHFLILRLGRHQETVATSLPASDLPGRFEEFGYAMVVADGCGKAGAGAVASRIAVSTLAHLALHYGRWNLRVDPQTAEAMIAQAEWFYERAAHAVDEHRLAEPALAEMRTTLTVTFSAGNDLFYAHVGHSRAYLFRDGELTQLTRDHTLDERLSRSPGPALVPPGAEDLRHILTDAIGAGNGPPIVDVEWIRLYDNDIILLCTDGLTGVLDDDTIADVLANPRSPDEQCQRLGELAIRNGSDDDVTVLMAQYHIPSPSAA